VTVFIKEKYIMNKVKKYGKCEIEVEGLPMQKNSWQCQECGRVWKFRRQAQNCTHQDSYYYNQKQCFIPEGFKEGV